jgi:hypothetical protein
MAAINSSLSVPDGIKAPFPPNVTVDNLLSRSKLPDGTNKRIPCAFIIYRTSLQRELESKGYKFSLSQISSMASNEWKNESEEVKYAYINLVNDAKIRYNGQDQNNSVVESASYENMNLHADSENTFIRSLSFSDIINENSINLEIGNNPMIPESSFIVDEFKERIRILEERLNLITELLGVQFDNNSL